MRRSNRAIRLATLALCGAVAIASAVRTTAAQSPPVAQAKADPPPFRWVNPLPEGKFPHLRHATFRSPSLKHDVGYCVLLPPGYDDAANGARRYPVVYYLHGGRPGSEAKSASLSEPIHAAMTKGDVPPAIYVFVNGGPVSHYDLPDGRGPGATVFVAELIPHVDATYRTLAARAGRALEGFSQGGRGTARIAFRHPELFCSAAPGGGGFATEKRISESGGEESPTLKFAPGDDAWTLAKNYAARPATDPKLRLLVFVGTQDFNYEANLEYMRHLEALRIPFERLVVPDVPHSAGGIYAKQGLTIMRFHAESFRLASGAK